jgi:ADP-ribosylglycohydrolase
MSNALPTWPLLERLVNDRTLSLSPDALPLLADAAPSPAAANPERVRGMLLGHAIGDALGNSSEGLNPSERHERFGRIETYLPNRHADDQRVGVPSDDTQLAAWTLQHLLLHDGLHPESLSDTFAARRILGVGRATYKFQEARRRGVPWTRAGQPAAGNGVLMRIAAALPPHMATGGRGLWADVALNAFVTHNDRLAIASAVAFTDVLQRLLAGERPSGPEWWLDRYLALGRPLEGDTSYTKRVTRGPLANWQGSAWRLVDEHVRAAVRQGASVLDAQDTWYSGAFLMETIPTVLMILARHGDDPQAAMLAAVNDTHDNDTIAAIVGAAVGASHGAEALPEEWRDGLLGRIETDDDGAYHLLVEEALGRWVYPRPWGRPKPDVHIPDAHLRLEHLPPPDADLDAMAVFAHTYSGYRVFGGLTQCAAQAKRGPGETLGTMRNWVSFQHRRWRHTGYGPSEEELGELYRVVERMRGLVAK